MSQPRPSIYRDALQVSPEMIAALKDDGLNQLMAQLLKAEAYQCGLTLDKILVNTEEKAKDDGCDGWSGAPETRNDWLGASDTCWQFKAGTSGQPAKLPIEVAKKIPTETLKRGGRFVVVVTGSANGKKGESDRLAKITKKARAIKIPTSNIEVIGSERLANWCNRHPAIAARWASRPDGLWTLDAWSESDEHQVPWQAAAPIQAEITARRADLDLMTGTVQHIHVHGPPGVGKTRFALELCRDAEWSSSVIYIRQASDLRLTELIDSAAADSGVRIVVVADEVQFDQLRPLRDSVGRGDGRIRLISVGHSRSPDPARIPALAVAPLDSEIMRQVVSGWHRSLPREHVDFVVRFADGYVRLAKLAADAVNQSPDMDVRGLLGRDEIRDFLSGMLGEGDRHPLHVVAVLSTIGWTGDIQVEGERVAAHFGLDWNAVRVSVEEFHDRLGIAPRGGRYRYISPTPLGTYLAAEAWRIYPDLLRSLPDELPSDSAREAYYERLKSIASNPQVREYAREELSFFFRVESFTDAPAVRRWSALATADPTTAARNALKVLKATSLEDRRRIEGSARREMIWTLARLAWDRSSFHDATLALGLLAEAENETWSNNATGEFIARFQIALGGTAQPYIQRLAVIDELLSEDRPSLTSIAVRALAQAGDQTFARIGTTPVTAGAPDIEWSPDGNSDRTECAKAAVSKLCEIAESGIPEIQTELIGAATKLADLLRAPEMRDVVSRFFDLVNSTIPDAQETLRRLVADIIRGDQMYWHELDADDIAQLDELHSRYEDPGIGGRLKQQVGVECWDEDEEQLDLGPLAKELLSPNVLTQQWPWLTSGVAAKAWSLGEALAAFDSEGRLAEELPQLPGGNDCRLLCGYIHAQRLVFGDDWYDRWMASQHASSPKPLRLLFEAAWRCGVTESVSRILVELLNREEVSTDVVGQLRFGHLDVSLSAETLGSVLRAMAETGHSATAIGILDQRLKRNAEEVDVWKPLALRLVTTPELVTGAHSVSRLWKNVASVLVAQHAAKIATAIFQAQSQRAPHKWFAKYSEASVILESCAEADPTGVWLAMIPFLATPADATLFSIGFPSEVLERLQSDDIFKWIAENPEERSAIAARLVGDNMSADDTLPSLIIGLYGDVEQVGSAFFSEYITGSWSGPASMHWDKLADSLEAVSARTTLPKLRRWASDSVRSLREMATRDRQREEEEEIRHGE